MNSSPSPSSWSWRLRCRRRASLRFFPYLWGSKCWTGWPPSRRSHHNWDNVACISQWRPRTSHYGWDIGESDILNGIFLHCSLSPDFSGFPSLWVGLVTCKRNLFILWVANSLPVTTCFIIATFFLLPFATDIGVLDSTISTLRSWSWSVRHPRLHLKHWRCQMRKVLQLGTTNLSDGLHSWRLECSRHW